MNRRALLLLLGGMIGARAARAECSIFHSRDLAYAMRVAGVTVADLELRVRCTGALALVEMEMRNRGLAAFFSGRNRTTMTALVAVGGGAPRPTRFRATYIKPDRTRETAVDFAPDGSLAGLSTRNRGREQESPVPPELREPTVDPLTVLLRLSDWLASGPPAGERVTFPVFEGRKRGDLEVVYEGPTMLANQGREKAAHRLAAALRGLSGFEADDVMVTLPGEPPSWLEVHASAEPMPMPLLIRSTEARLATSIELVGG